MEFKNYYKLLGVNKDADAKTIKAAYRKLARQYHPDMNSDAGAEDKFKEVSEAYHVLKNVQLRAEFDELLRYGANESTRGNPPPGWNSTRPAGFRDGAAAGGDYSEFFNSMFGGARQGFKQPSSSRPRSLRGQDIEILLSLSLLETLSEHQKDVEFNLPLEGAQQQAIKKHLKVKIPRGVVDGEKIRLTGQGMAGLNGGATGDLYLLIRLMPHPFFEISGQNLLLNLPLSPWEATLGTSVTVPTLDGKIKLSIPVNTQSGSKFRIKGKGLIGKISTGDILATVNIVLPATTSVKGAALWRDLAASENFDPRLLWQSPLD